MTKLSTAQVRMLELIAGATDSGVPFIPPKGPSSRPAKFLKNSELVADPNMDGGLWLTDTGRAELARQKGGENPVTTHNHGNKS